MKRIFFALSLLFAFTTISTAQVVKGSGLLYFASAPNSAADTLYGAEIALSLDNRELYTYNRATQAWEVQPSGKVYEIATIADTTTITAPTTGDIAYVDSSIVAFRGTLAWLVFQGGASGPTQEYVDSLHAAQQSQINSKLDSIQAGGNITIVGTGTNADPLVISATASGSSTDLDSITSVTYDNDTLTITLLSGQTFKAEITSGLDTAFVSQLASDTAQAYFLMSLDSIAANLLRIEELDSLSVSSVYWANDTVGIVLNGGDTLTAPLPVRDTLAFVADVGSVIFRTDGQFLNLSGGWGVATVAVAADEMEIRVDTSLLATVWRLDSLFSVNGARLDAQQAAIDTLPTQTFVDSLHNAQQAALDTQADTLTAHRTDIETLKPRIRYFTPTASVFTLDTLATVNVLDYTSVSPFVSTTVHIDSSGGIGPYFFHARGTGQQVVDFPAHFLDAAGVEVDGGSLYILVEDQLWDCYLDPTLNDFFCNTKTFLVQENIPFISTWNTNLVSPTAGTDTLATDSLSVRLPLVAGQPYGFIADWGDGSASYINAWDSPEVVHTYDTAGTYTITLTGTINGFRFNNLGDRTKIIDISQWGTMEMGNLGGYFWGCANLDISAEDIIDLSGVTNMSRTFQDCAVLNGPTNIGDWNTSSVTTMEFIFQSASAFNQPIRDWNTGAVIIMSRMFNAATAFNQPIGDWNTGSVINMQEMFRDAVAFNQPIGAWNTGAVTNMVEMFRGAGAFNQPIGAWNTGAVTDMQAMFRSAVAFNQPIRDWNTGSVINMTSLFNTASAFNQPIGTWNTSSVIGMSNIFNNAVAFNQPIGAWNTGSVINMQEMFRSAVAFNQPIGAWNTGAVTNMQLMFRAAFAFNQPLDSLNVAAVTNFANFMVLKAAANYDAGKLDSIYIFWTNQQLTPALSISFGTIQYTAAGTAGRNLLTRANATVAVTNAVNNAGEIQITATAHGMSTGDKVLIYDVGGTVEADGGWIITVVDVDNFTLDESAFVNTYTSGGTARTGFGYTVTDGGITP